MTEVTRPKRGRPAKKKAAKKTAPPSETAASAAQEQPLKRERKRRVPFGGFVSKLEVANKDPAYFYYWQKNTGDYIQRMLDAGYEFVRERDARRYAPETLTNTSNQSIDGRVEIFGGREANGQEYSLVLMRQPMEYHLEDMEHQEKRNQAIDEAVYRGEFDNDPYRDGNISQGQSVRYGNVDVTVKHEE